MTSLKGLSAIPAVLAICSFLLGQGAILAQEAVLQPAEARPLFTPEQLEGIVAPIALHPDDLVSQILIASTYPLEVVDAARWLKANPNLQGDQLAVALEAKNWDPSVKSLVNFSEVLFMMDGNLEWMQELGDAVLSQQPEVMDAVQRLRSRAIAAGNLQSTPEETVAVQDQIIRIVPAAPEVIYVPVYNPVVVYGAWPYPSYPPFRCYPPGFVIGIRTHFFLPRVVIGLPWGYAWGHCQWRQREIEIDFNRHVQLNPRINREVYRRRWETTRQAFPVRVAGPNAWGHDPEHRKGVIYRDERISRGFNHETPPNPQSREAFRGYPESERPGVRTGVAQPPRPAVRPAPAPTIPRPREEVRPAARAPAPPARVDSRSATRTPPAPVRAPSAFQGYTRGEEARTESSRGQTSRQASPPPPRSAVIPRATSGGRPSATTGGKDSR